MVPYGKQSISQREHHSFFQVDICSRQMIHIETPNMASRFNVPTIENTIQVVLYWQVSSANSTVDTLQEISH